MTGTTELITNLTDLIPRMSAFDATVVLRERIETNAPDKTAIDFVIMFSILSIIYVDSVLVLTPSKFRVPKSS